MVMFEYNIFFILAYLILLIFIIFIFLSFRKDLNEKYFKKKDPFISWPEFLIYFKILSALFNPDKYLKKENIDEGIKYLIIYAVLMLFIFILVILLAMELV